MLKYIKEPACDLEIIVGGIDSCPLHGPTLSEKPVVYIHACKEPCHRARGGHYVGNLDPKDPNYLYYADERDLYLNMIDPSRPLFKMNMFLKFLDWSRHHWKAGRALSIHCNLGVSRAPTLALLFLAKEAKTIPADSFAGAATLFKEMYDFGDYGPGAGLVTFMAENWKEFDL